MKTRITIFVLAFAAGVVCTLPFVGQHASPVTPGPATPSTAGRTLPEAAPQAVPLKSSTIGSRLDLIRAEMVGLAETDGAAAVTEALARLTPGELDLLLPDILKAWALAAPEAAIAWFTEGSIRETIPGGADYHACSALLETAFRTLGAADPLRAVALARGLETEGAWQIALAESARGAVLSGRIQDVLSAGGTGDLSDDQRLWFRSALLAQWAVLRPGEAVAAWQELPADEKPHMLTSVGRAWMRTEPNAAATWWLEQSAPEQKLETMSGIITSWASMSPNQAASWLESRPEGPEREEGRAALAQAAFERDPESALVWAASIRDTDRARTLWLDLLRTLHHRDPALAANLARTQGAAAGWQEATAEILQASSSQQ